MKLSLARIWLGMFAILVIASTTAFADRIQLVQGRRPVKDKISFTVDILRERNGSPRYEGAPEDLQIFATFADHPTSGLVYIDGKAIGRFDEAQQFNSNPADISYGRHTITLTISNPANLNVFYVTVRGGVVREIMEGEAAVIPTVPGLEQRITELERKVHELETEIATLKKRRNH